MKIGFIGAGKVGITLGKYMKERNMCVSGYFSRSPESAQKAAKFTDSRHYETIEAIVMESDVIFLTVPDGAIGTLWKYIRNLAIENKIFCHCSGALSSAVFSEIDQIKGFGYSIHPFFAVSDPWMSYQNFSQAFITIEGDAKYLQYFRSMFEIWGPKVQFISSAQKTKYHAAAVFASNHVLALIHVAKKMLESCGFEPEMADHALLPIVLNNVMNVKMQGLEHSLTGPVERGDVSTVKAHAHVLKDDEKQLYMLLSDQLLQLAQIKNPKRDYKILKDYIREELNNEEYSGDI